MPPKGGNAKKESGRAKKADNEAKKKDAAADEADQKDSVKWSDGSKGKSAKDEKAEKRQAELARKAENARLLAEEEVAPPPKPKPTSKGKNKKKESEKPAGPGAIAADGELDPTAPKVNEGGEEVESFAATGIDNAIDVLDVVNAKMDKASLGSQAAKAIDTHPERRFKAVLEAYTERELPIIREEHPGLRLNQYKDLLFKQFQKSPENPFNQTNASYDATKEEKLSALNAKRSEVEERHREKGKQ